jgi:hypothetical protein
MPVMISMRVMHVRLVRVMRTMTCGFRWKTKCKKRTE